MALSKLKVCSPASLVVSPLTPLQSSFELDLRLQEFIELTKTDRRKDAMSYAQKHLTPFFATHAKQVTRCMGLLATHPSTPLARYQVSPLTLILLAVKRLHRNCTPPHDGTTSSNPSPAPPKTYPPYPLPPSSTRSWHPVCPPSNSPHAIPHLASTARRATRMASGGWRGTCRGAIM